LLCVFGGQSARAGDPDEKNVLVVFESASGHYEPFLNLIESSVRAHLSEQVNFSAAYLDYQRLEDESYGESQAETIRLAHSVVKPDILVAASIHSLQFVMRYRDKLFPGAPIVFTELSAGELQGQKLLPDVTGLMVSVAIRETIDLALRLHTDTTAVALVADTPGPAEKHWVTVARSELHRLQDNIKEIDIIGPPSRRMVDRIAALPAHTVVLFEAAPLSSSDPAVSAYDVLKAAAQHVPTYSPFYALCFDYGCIGGAYSDGQKNARRTGEIVARVLSGERPESIPIVEDSEFQVMVDWRALQRWHIPESALPAGSVIRNRPPSFWESYRQYILAAIVVTTILAPSDHRLAMAAGEASEGRSSAIGE
jgi:hypothetical protein